ncbi:MAG: hypothetical protein JNM10_01195 [Planctomycetia bacterium]|nr:hypothetical protein [Planctomycetia bacterium]
MKRSLFASALVSGLVGLSFVAAPAPAGGKEYKVVEVAGGVTVRGVVTLALSAEEKDKFALPKVIHGKDNEKGCGEKEHDSERLVFDRATLGVGNAVVYLKDVTSGKEWPEAMKSEDRVATIDQKGCKYVPHVLLARTSTQMVVLNSDAADHNIHGFKTPADKNSLQSTKFNFTSAPNSKNEDTADAFLEDAGLYLVKCDVHPWMNAYVLTVEHPYYTVTSATAEGDRKPGEFVLENVPPGSYTLVVWKEGMHEVPVEADGKISAYNYSENIVKEIPITVEAGKECVVTEVKIELQKK